MTRRTSRRGRRSPAFRLFRSHYCDRTVSRSSKRPHKLAVQYLVLVLVLVLDPRYCRACRWLAPRIPPTIPTYDCRVYYSPPSLPRKSASSVAENQSQPPHRE
ncbi:MAG: hypothetical protein ACOYD3_12855 [Kiritimatiellia bacterium]